MAFLSFCQCKPLTCLVDENIGLALKPKVQAHAIILSGVERSLHGQIPPPTTRFPSEKFIWYFLNVCSLEVSFKFSVLMVVPLFMHGTRKLIDPFWATSRCTQGTDLGSLISMKISSLILKLPEATPQGGSLFRWFLLATNLTHGR